MSIFPSTISRCRGGTRPCCAAADGVRLVDAGSANGTFLSGARLPAQQPVPLSDGAQIRVGQTLIKFVAPAIEDEKVTTAIRKRAARTAQT